MSNVETIGAADNPTGLLTLTKTGRVVDLLNLPGLKKMELIESKEMEMDSFVSPPNMTGLKLKILRASHRERIEIQLKKHKAKKAAKADFKVGDFISYKEASHEVLKVREDAVMVMLGKKKVWIPKNKVGKG